MARTDSFLYSGDVHLRMGVAAVVSYDDRGLIRWSPKITRLDPAAIGRAILGYTATEVHFSSLGRPIGDTGPVPAQAVGAPSPGNLERTGARVDFCSDGTECRFQTWGPSEKQNDFSGTVDTGDRLSPGSQLHYEPNVPKEWENHPLFIAPWRDPEMLGQAVLTLFGLCRAPFGKALPPSIFQPPEPRRRRHLHRAAKDGNTDQLPAKVRGNRARMDPVDTAGMTPLMLAVGNGHTETLAHLLSLGADPHLQDHQGRTPLHFAAGAGHHKAAGLLLEAGAAPSPPDHFGETPLHCAAAEGFQEVMVELLNAGADTNARDMLSGGTPLHRAARAGHDNAIRTLLESGAEANAPNEWGKTPLHVAAAYGHVHTVRTLIEMGADPNLRNHRNESPLHLAVFFQRLDCIAVLAESGTDLSLPDDDGDTALHVAACMNRDRAAQLLLDAGAELEPANRDGLTPLDLAVTNIHLNYPLSEHNSEVALLLLQRGATVSPDRLTIGDRHILWPHLTPKNLLWADGDLIYEKLPDLPDDRKRLLPKTDSNGFPTVNTATYHDSILQDAVWKDLPDLVEFLLDNGVSASRAAGSYPPLQIAALTGNLEMIKLLLDRGAEIDGTYEKMERADWWDRRPATTALHRAVENGHDVVAAYLLERGARPIENN